MKTRYTFDVTQEDIDKGMRENSHNCAVARAMARAIPNGVNFDVTMQTMRCTIDGKRYAWLAAFSVQEYIVAYDDGRKVSPFTVHIRNPQTWNSRQKSSRGRAADAQAKADARAGVEPVAKTETLRGADGRFVPNEDPYMEPRTPGSTRPMVRGPRKNRAYGHRVMPDNREES